MLPTHTFLDDIMDWNLGHGVLGMLVFFGELLVIAAVMISLLLWLASRANRGRATVTFYRDEWEPTQGHYETQSYYNVALKMPATRRVWVVTQWTRRNEPDQKRA